MAGTGEKALGLIRSYDGPALRMMEVCGTHTHEIFRLGVRSILPSQVRLISGPGCPVCVTGPEYIDQAVWLALEKGVQVCTFGDLVRVPGSRMSLAQARARGGNIKVVYSADDALDLAREHPDQETVFLSVGFETTTPAACLAVEAAEAEGVKNFSLLTANKTMPGAYRMLKDSVDVFLYPGHVNAIAGNGAARAMLGEGVSGVVTGFTAAEILTAIALALVHFKEGKPFFVNAYPRVVKEEGNLRARALVDRLMEPVDARWRGLGTIPGSGLELRRQYQAFDARKKFAVPVMEGRVDPACRCGQVLTGALTPGQCPLFGRACTPLHPVGACMVSGEGACSAFYQYGRQGEE